MSRVDQVQASCGRCGYRRSAEMATCPVCSFDSTGTPGLQTVPLTGRNRVPLVFAAVAGAVFLVMLTALAGFSAGTSSHSNQIASPAATARPVELAHQQLVVAPALAAPTSTLVPAPSAVPAVEPTAAASASHTQTEAIASAKVSSLRASLEAAWGHSDWPAAIAALTELRLVAPDNADDREKLYTARVEYADVLAARAAKRPH